MQQLHSLKPLTFGAIILFALATGLGSIPIAYSFSYLFNQSHNLFSSIFPPSVNITGLLSRVPWPQDYLPQILLVLVLFSDRRINHHERKGLLFGFIGFALLTTIQRVLRMELMLELVRHSKSYEVPFTEIILYASILPLGFLLIASHWIPQFKSPIARITITLWYIIYISAFVTFARWTHLLDNYTSSGFFIYHLTGTILMGLFESIWYGLILWFLAKRKEPATTI